MEDHWHEAPPFDYQSFLPPSLHDPTERMCVASFGGWEMRCFPRNGPKHAYMAPRGMLHLQLWCPSYGVSILTPSVLTDRLFELWTPTERLRLPCLKDVASTLADTIGILPPCVHLIHHFESWLVWAPAIGAVPKTSTGEVCAARNPSL